MRQLAQWAGASPFIGPTGRQPDTRALAVAAGWQKRSVTFALGGETVDPVELLNRHEPAYLDCSASAATTSAGFAA